MLPAAGAPLVAAAERVSVDAAEQAVTVPKSRRPASGRPVHRRERGGRDATDPVPIDRREGRSVGTGSGSIVEPSVG